MQTIRFSVDGHLIEKHINTFEFADKISRRKVQPIQLIIAEDDRDQVPCLVYNSDGQKKTLNDVAFVIFEPTKDKSGALQIKVRSFIDLQFGTQRIFKKDKQSFNTNQLMLTLSSEVQQGHRLKLNSQGDPIGKELYYT